MPFSPSQGSKFTFTKIVECDNGEKGVLVDVFLRKSSFGLLVGNSRIKVHSLREYGVER
jgi:hypothetical protein